MTPKCLALLFMLAAQFCMTGSLIAQSDPEFPAGFVMHAKLHNGMITNFHRGTGLYTGGLQVISLVGILPQKLRAGLIGGAFYANKRWDAQFGPTLSVKLKTFNAGPFGSAAHIHLTADHLWGTNKQNLAGGGIHVDLLNKLVLGLTAHRDYAHSTWWLQTALGIRISKLKKIKEPFND